MGIDATATLGYGIKLQKNIVDKLFDKYEEDFIEKGFSFISQGGSDDTTSGCLNIEKSNIMIFCWDDPKLIEFDKLLIKEDWNEKLKSWAKKYNIKNPKIGWWLCCSMG